MGKGSQRGRSGGGGRQRSNSPPVGVGGDSSSLSSGGSGGSGGNKSKSKSKNKASRNNGNNGNNVNRKAPPKELVTVLSHSSNSSTSTSGSGSGSGSSSAGSNKRSMKKKVKKQASSGSRAGANFWDEGIKSHMSTGSPAPAPLLVRYGLIIVPLVSIVLMVFTFRALDEGMGVGVGGVGGAGAASVASMVMTAPTTSTLIPPSSSNIFEAPRSVLPPMSTLLQDLIDKQQHGVHYHQQQNLHQRNSLSNSHSSPSHAMQSEAPNSVIHPPPKLCADGITYGYSDWASLRSAIHSLNEINKSHTFHPHLYNDMRALPALHANANANANAASPHPTAIPTASPRLFGDIAVDGPTSAAAAAVAYNSKSTSPAIEVEEMADYFTTSDTIRATTDQHQTHFARFRDIYEDHYYADQYYHDHYDDPLFDHDDEYYYNYGVEATAPHSPPDPFVICPGVVLRDDRADADGGPIFVDSDDVIIECESCAVKRGGTHLAFGPNARNVEIRGITFMDARTSSITFHHNGASVIFDDCTWIGNSGLLNGGAVADLNSTSAVSFFRCEISDSKQSPRRVSGGAAVAGSSLTIRN